MEIKKTSKADLEKDRGLFFLMSFILAFASFFVALEWNNEDSFDFDFPEETPAFIEEELEYGPVVPEITAPLPIPVIESQISPVVINDFKIVEDTSKIKYSEVVSLEEAATVPKEEIVDTAKIILDDPEILFMTEVDVMPEFPGGLSALVRYIYGSIKYPDEAIKQRVQGRVICSFIIGKDGAVSAVKIEEGIHPLLDQEVIKVLQTLPSWKPGMKKNKYINVKYILPIVFRF